MSALRRQLLEVSLQMQEFGFNRGTSGNASVRLGSGFLITPSALPVSAMTAGSMIEMDMTGHVRQQGGRPSSEWRLHRDILVGRSEIGAVLHMHSPFATTLACLRRNIPAVHYMIAAAGGKDIRCAPYSLFGEQTLSDDALHALTGRKACLLANHGMVALGTDLQEALAVAVEVESVCELYWRALQVGEPFVLTDQEMQAVSDKFVDYKRPAL